MAQPGEASVEEILESIKKVIARDSASIAPSPRSGNTAQRRTEAAQEEPEAPASILELADYASEADDIDDDLAEKTEAPLISSASREAMRESLAALAVISEPGAPPQIVRSGETSLEGLVREMLRPMLAEWLDRNLPAMVETLVSREIERIVGKRG